MPLHRLSRRVYVCIHSFVFLTVTVRPNDRNVHEKMQLIFSFSIHSFSIHKSHSIPH